MPITQQEMPVYLFTGFLDAGKTTFIQDALESEEFGEGERTLLLVCEEGEVEYRPASFCRSGGAEVHIERIEEESDLSSFLLKSLARECEATRVLIEWNGMWELASLYENAPGNWTIYQQLMLADAGTFLMYNRNIRQRTFEQLQGAELVAFNRCQRGADFEDWKLEVHKICRVANRSSQILYEFGPEDVEIDDIQDPLPYDMSRPVIQIGDDMFAEWYRDLNENQDNYEGKTILCKGRAVVSDELAPGRFIFGRHVMTCCEEDISFAGLLGKYEGASEEESEGREAPEQGDPIASTADLTSGQWVEIRATVKNEFDPIYGEVGPVLYCTRLTTVEPCEPEVATF